jgi:endo-1,4-beta-D-glucanase Y
MSLRKRISSRICAIFLPTLLLAPVAYAADSCVREWPAWNSFKQDFMSDGGRIIDPGSERQHTTSEGQSYALFFALVANDRKNFDLILNWTENNLAQGDLTAWLPAWQWGKKDDGSWGVVDSNSASDSDLWIAYTLGEAGRLWDDRRYVALSSLLANRILNDEVADLPKLGPTILPAPKGFKVSDTSWKLNPSYVPLQLLQWFKTHSSDPRWQAVYQSSRQVLQNSAPKGYAPDWVIYDADKGFLLDTQGQEKGEGAFNAIRVYLWAGLMAADAPDRKLLLDTYRPFADFISKNGYPPLSVNILSGQAEKPGPAGFSAASLPFLHALAYGKAHDEQIMRIDALTIKNNAYYDQVLAMYALGWNNKLYAFDAQGNLAPQWQHCK